MIFSLARVFRLQIRKTDNQHNKMKVDKLKFSTECSEIYSNKAINLNRIECRLPNLLKLRKVRLKAELQLHQSRSGSGNGIGIGNAETSRRRPSPSASSNQLKIVYSLTSLIKYH